MEKTIGTGYWATAGDTNMTEGNQKRTTTENALGPTQCVNLGNQWGKSE